MESLFAIILGAVSKKFIDRMKKHGIDPFEALMLFCVGVGTIYALFKFFLPIDFQESVLSFTTTAGLAAVSVHEILKRVNGTNTSVK